MGTRPRHPLAPASAMPTCFTNGPQTQSTLNMPQDHPAATGYQWQRLQCHATGCHSQQRACHPIEQRVCHLIPVGPGTACPTGHGMAREVGGWLLGARRKQRVCPHIGIRKQRACHFICIFLPPILLPIGFRRLCFCSLIFLTCADRVPTRKSRRNSISAIWPVRWLDFRVGNGPGRRLSCCWA